MCTAGFRGPGESEKSYNVVVGYLSKIGLINLKQTSAPGKSQGEQTPLSPDTSILYVAICALIVGGLLWAFMVFICMAGEAFYDH